MKRIKGRQIILTISLLAGFLLAYVLFKDIFQYEKLADLFDKPFYYRKQHISAYMFLLIMMNIVTVQFVYQMYKMRDNQGKIKYSKLLIVSIIQSILEFYIYFLFFFLNQKILLTSYRVFAWYNSYDFIKIAYYFFCFSQILKVIIIYMSLRIESTNSNNDTKLKVKGQYFLFGYGALVVFIYFLPAIVIKREVTLIIPFEEQMSFVGQNGTGNLLFDSDNYYDMEYYIWEETEDMNEVLKRSYTLSGDAEIISSNNGKLKNGDKVDIRWKEKTKDIEDKLNIKIDSKVSTYTVEGLSEKILFEDLTESQKKAVDVKLDEYISSQEFADEMRYMLDVGYENYKMNSVNKMMIVDYENPYENSTINENILKKSRANSYYTSANVSNGDIEELLVYEIVLKHPTNDNKVYYYIGCNLSMLSEDIEEEKAFNDINVETSFLTYSSTPKSYDSLMADEDSRNIEIKSIYEYDINIDKFPVAWDSRQIMLNGKVLTLPANISNFNDLGYELNSLDKEKSLKSKDSEFLIEISNNDNEVITATFYNASDGEADISDCTILSLIVDENSGEVYLPGGFQIGSSIRDVRMLYGTPYDVLVDDSKEKLVYSSDWGMVEIDFNNGKLERYKLVINFENAKLSNDNKDE